MAFVVPVMRSHQINKLLTTFCKTFPHAPVSRMESEGKGVQGMDLSGSTKFFDGKVGVDCPEHFSIEIEILAL